MRLLLRHSRGSGTGVCSKGPSRDACNAVGQRQFYAWQVSQITLGSHSGDHAAATSLPVAQQQGPAVRATIETHAWTRALSLVSYNASTTLRLVTLVSVWRGEEWQRHKQTDSSSYRQTDPRYSHTVGQAAPAEGVEGSEDSCPGVHIFQHGCFPGAVPCVALWQLPQLRGQAVLNVQGLGTPLLACCVLLKGLHLQHSQTVCHLIHTCIWTDDRTKTICLHAIVQGQHGPVGPRQLGFISPESLPVLQSGTQFDGILQMYMPAALSAQRRR